jgi:SAM-dependent methyltransferase
MGRDELGPRPDPENLSPVPDDGLRGIFDEDPELYERARPGYPPDLFADLAELTGIGPGARVVEIGPGTGQATAGLVALGAHVVGVELGAGLAALLRRKLASRVEIVVGAFEDWLPPAQPFDVVAAFTSWHWLDPAVRAARVAALLRTGGALATVTTTHVLGNSGKFFEQAQRCYERWDPNTPAGLRLIASDAVPPSLDEIDESALFQRAVRRRYEQDVTYSTRGYLDVLSTYSGHRALTRERREGLFGCISDLSDHRHGGVVTKRYLHELRVAHLALAGQRRLQH